MDAGYFDTVMKRIGRATLKRVARGLRTPGHRQQKARMIAEAVLTAKPTRTADGDLLIPTIYWRSAINDVYLWGDLSKSSLELKDADSTYNGLALAVCFAAFSRSWEPALQEIELDALRLVGGIEANEVMIRAAADITDFATAVDEMLRPDRPEQLELGLKSNGYLIESKRESSGLAEQVAPIVCRSEIVRERAYRSSREYALFNVHHFCPRHVKSYEGLFVSVTVRGSVSSKVQMKVRLNFDLRPFRETKELAVRSDEYGFFHYRDHIEGLAFTKDGTLEVVPVFDGIPLRAKIYVVQKSCTFRPSKGYLGAMDDTSTYLREHWARP